MLGQGIFCFLTFVVNWQFQNHLFHLTNVWIILTLVIIILDLEGALHSLIDPLTFRDVQVWGYRVEVVCPESHISLVAGLELEFRSLGWYFSCCIVLPSENSSFSTYCIPTVSVIPHWSCKGSVSKWLLEYFVNLQIFIITFQWV